MRLLRIGLVMGFALAAAGCVTSSQGLTQTDADQFVKKTIREGEKPGKAGAVN